VLDDPWHDAAIPIRFHAPSASVKRIVAEARLRPFDAVLAVGDRPAALAARFCDALGLPGHGADGAGAARNKLETRRRLRDSGLPVPRFVVAPAAADPLELAHRVTFPAVVKPVALSGSRGVMRVDDPNDLARALERLRALLARPDIRGERDPAHERVLVESFIDGHEFALEGLMTHGCLQTLAIFDKPDPLDGPFFEETIYVTLPDSDGLLARRISEAVGRAAAAIGLRHGPIHAECRVNDTGVFVLEVAARPIGGICARALRFCQREDEATEQLLLRHALGEEAQRWRREAGASGVMMIPIPRRGVYRRADGVEQARAVTGIEDVVVTAKPGQVLIPLPEGASYLGFIFARASEPTEVDAALRRAHAQLVFTIEAEWPVVTLANG
jgi:biotin carboxylase